MSSLVTSNNNYKTIKETLVNNIHVKNKYDFHSVQVLRDFLKIIKDLNTMTGYGTDNTTYYYSVEQDEQGYFDMLYRIKRNLIGELNYEN